MKKHNGKIIDKLTLSKSGIAIQ